MAIVSSPLPAPEGGDVRRRRKLPSPLLLIALLAWLVPASRRGEWVAQWHGELEHYERWLARLARPPLTMERLIWSRALGAVPHACLLRLHQWSSTMWLDDLRFALRSLSRRPAFTAVAVLTLALGIGANATVFSWVEAVLLRPLPGVREQGRLYTVQGTSRTRSDMATSYPNFRDMRDMFPPDVGRLTAYRLVPTSLRVTDRPERAWATLVSGNYFQVLGVGAALGRVLTPEDDRSPDKHPVAVITDGYWRRRFGADPSIVGRTVTLNGRPFTVVGVSAPAFRGSFVGLSVDMFVPLMMQGVLLPGDRLEARGHHWLKVLLRLQPDASVASAEAAFRVVADRLAAANAKENDGRGLALFPLWRAPSEASGFMGPLLLVLLVVVALVLLIVCANVANLLLARATSREREVAIRLAIGANRWQIVRQLLVESLCLAAFGAAAGVIVSHFASRGLAAFVPPTGSPVELTLGASPLVVLAGALLAVATGVLFGLAPALQFTRPSLVPALREGSGSTSSRSRTRLRQGLVILQVAVSLVLLVAAGLFGRTLREARHADLGYSATEGLLVTFDLTPLGWKAEQGAEFYRQLLDRVAALPRVDAVGLASDVPLGLGTSSDTSGTIDGYEPAPDEEITLHYNRVSHGYFEAFGVAILRGRGFTPRDDGQAPGAVIINETMARRYWKGRDALGGRVRMGSQVLEVVGIARDGKYRSLSESPRPYMYLPLLRFYDPNPILHVRSSLPAATLLPALEAQVQALAPDVPLFEAQTYAEQRDLSLLLQRIAGSLLGIFGGLALLLASVGLYGVLSYLVGQRRREMGVRMALGARPGQVVALVMVHGLWLVVTGAVVGLVASLAAAPLLASQLVGVSATDPLIYAGTLTILLAAAALACGIPAHRASRVDPVRVLRDE